MIVLAAVLVAILLVVWACGGSGSPTPKSAPSPGHGGAARGGDGSPSGSSSAPGGTGPGGTAPGGASPSAGLSTDGPQAEGGADDQPPVPRPTGPAPGCPDDDMSVSARTASDQIPAGSYPTLFLTIGNSSTHACTRDIGADAQELWITHDGRRVWSSDYCNPNHDKDVRRFDPGVQVTFHLIWDGRSASRGCKDRTVLPRGRYELAGRVGGKTATPFRFELT